MAVDISTPFKSPGQSCLVSDLDLFSPAPLFEAISSTFFDEIHPICPLSETSQQINFVNEACGYFIDLSGSFIRVTTSISMPDGTPLAANEDVGFIDYVVNSLFSNFDLQINNQSVTSNYNTYNYYSYFQYFLATGLEARASKLQASGCYPELDKSCNTIGTVGPFKTRAGLTALGAKATFMGMIHHPIANSIRVLPPMLALSFVWTKATSAWVLKAKKAEAYKHKIHSMTLHLKKLKMTSDFQLSFEKQLSGSPCLLPIKQSYVKEVTIPSGVNSYSIESPFMSTMVPNLCVLVSIF